MSIIRIVGAPATGKSTIRSYLAGALSLPSLGIDDERLRYGWGNGAWEALARKVQESEHCLLETSGVSPHDAAVCRGRKTFTILCTASRAARKERLSRRLQMGYALAQADPDYVTTLLAMSGPRLEPHITVNTSYGVDGRQLQNITACCRVFLDEMG